MSKLRFKDVNKIAYGFVTYISKLWSKKWQPTPVFLPGKSHGQRSLAGYSPWGCKELDTTEQLSTLGFPGGLDALQVDFLPLSHRGSSKDPQKERKG